MFITRGKSTLKQMAYARRVFGAKGETKKEIALDVGYSPNSANSVASHIEQKPGFHNAMAKLALESNNLALAAIHEFQGRGFQDFTNAELISALNVIGNAWEKFNAPLKEGDMSKSSNKLRTVVLQQIENQTVSPMAFPEEEKKSGVTSPEDVDDSLDF